MPTAFIVRPFGEKPARVNGVDVAIDFDRVERELIDPALTRLQVVGRTTGEIVEAGNIRDDMFALLLTRDLVVPKLPARLRGVEERRELLTREDRLDLDRRHSVPLSSALRSWTYVPAC